MCNRQVGIIIASTAAILLLLVTTAALVFHYLYSQRTENIPMTKMHFLSKLSQYNDIDFTSCKCQHSKENCEKEIEFHISLQIKKEEICTKDKIVCCNLKKILHWDKIVSNDKEKNNYENDGEENSAVEEVKIIKGPKVSNELSLSKYLDSSHCKCQSLEVECDKEIHIPQLSSVEMVSYCPHPNILCCNIEDEPNIEKETSQTIYEKKVNDITSLNSDNKLNLSLDKFLIKSNEGDESISTNFILDTLYNFKDEVNTSELSTETNQPTVDVISNLPEIKFKKSQTTENDLHKDKVQVYSHKKYSNNKGKSSSTEANHQEIVNLITKNERPGNSPCSGDDCHQNDQEENKSLNIISGNNDTDEAITDKTNVSLLNEFNLHDIMEVLNVINLTSSVSELSNSTSNTLDTFDPENDGISLYDMMEDLNMFDFTRSVSEPDNSNYSLENLYASGDSENDDINLHDMTEDLKMLNFTSVSELGDSNSPIENVHHSVNADNSILNLMTVDQSPVSSLDKINLYGMNDDLSIFNLASLMPEQDNYNSTSVTSYISVNTDNSKSSPYTDYVFYYSYLVVFLYVISFVVGYLVPVFSIPGLVIMQLVIFGFPHIIQSQFLDITSPVLRSTYGLFGLI